MATLSNINSLSAGATAHINVELPVDQPKPQQPTTLPADGLIVAEDTIYRSIDHKFLSHTAGVVVREPVALKLVPGGKYVLICSPAGGPQQEYILDAADWELRPKSIDEIMPTVHTLKAAKDTKAEVLLAGEFEGEDLPLHDIEVRYRGGLKNALLHPNQPGAAHKLEKDQSKLVRMGFEQLVEAREWYALLSIALGSLDLDSPSLASLPKALAASKKLKSFRETQQ